MLASPTTPVGIVRTSSFEDLLSNVTERPPIKTLSIALKFSPRRVSFSPPVVRKLRYENAVIAGAVETGVATIAAATGVAEALAALALEVPPAFVAVAANV